MSDERNALSHLLLGIEELLRGAADAASALRARTASRPDPARSSGGTSDRTSDRVEEMLASTRATLEREIARWELRGDDDPAARRVRDLFEAILDVMQPRPDAAANTRTSSDERMRKAGPRAPQPPGSTMNKRRGVPR